MQGKNNYNQNNNLNGIESNKTKTVLLLFETIHLRYTCM